MYETPHCQIVLPVIRINCRSCEWLQFHPRQLIWTGGSILYDFFFLRWILYDIKIAGYANEISSRAALAICRVFTIFYHAPNPCLRLVW